MAVNTTYGQGYGEVMRSAVFSLGQFTPNTTVTKKTGFGVPSGRRYRIARLAVVADAIPSDPDGTMTLTVRARDVSEAAFDTLVNAQDLETLIIEADRRFELTPVAEGSEFELTLNEGDTIDAQLINNSAAIGTNPNLFLIIEYFEIPLYPEQEFVKHPSAYGV